MAQDAGWSKPQGLDLELFEEYVRALADHALEIERTIGNLRSEPTAAEPIKALFRAFHNLKGDAALCRFEIGAQLAHHIESLLMRLRQGELGFTPMLGEALLLAFDRLEMAVEATQTGRDMGGLNLDRLIEGLQVLAQTRPGEIDAEAVRMIEAVTGFRPVSRHGLAASIPMQIDAGSRTTDLAFFRALALQFEQRSALFQGRTERLLTLAQAINDAAGQPVDLAQLEAASYMHDVGMMFLPEPVWLKSGKLDPEEWLRLHGHPGLAAGLLERMPGWSEAARIVAQHHETPDGRGYPAGLKADQICPGAKLMAIVDAFEAVMLKQIHRGQNRSMLRAAAEINASEQQFAAEWIPPFNRVAHSLFSGHDTTH